MPVAFHRWGRFLGAVCAAWLLCSLTGQVARAAGPTHCKNQVAVLDNLSPQDQLIWLNDDLADCDLSDKAKAEIYNLRGSTNFWFSLFQEAVADFSKAIDLGRETVELYRDRGTAYYNLGQYYQAIADLTQALALDPSGKALHKNRGGAYYRLAQFEAALADFSQAIAIDPKDAGAYVNRALTHGRLGETEQALEDFITASRLDPSKSADFLKFLTKNGFYAGAENAAFEAEQQAAMRSWLKAGMPGAS